MFVEELSVGFQEQGRGKACHPIGSGQFGVAQVVSGDGDPGGTVFGIQFDGDEIFGDIVLHLGFRQDVTVQFFAPASPLGVDIDQDELFGFFGLGETVFCLEPD